MHAFLEIRYCEMDENKEITGRALGGKARAARMTPEQRQEAARKAALAKRDLSRLPVATHGAEDHPLKIGAIEIPCYVLADGRRVIVQRGMLAAMDMSQGTAGKGGGDRIAKFAGTKGVSSRINNELLEVISNPVHFIAPNGSRAYGYEATVLADLCDAVLEARKAGELHYQQEHIAARCEVLVRAFARVGIIALVDEATGYQKDRAKDALAKILESFVAKELQPWVKTFPTEYYEQLFRLYGYQFPPEGKPQWRPQFFGKITNNVVYERIAPELLPELKKAASKAERKAKLHQWLTSDIGHPKLREHLASIVTLLKLAKTPRDFQDLVERIHPRFGDTYQLDFDKSE